MNYLTLAVGLLLVGISVLSVYRPNWVWGRPPAGLTRAQLRRVIRRRQIGTIAYFVTGALLVILSAR